MVDGVRALVIDHVIYSFLAWLAPLGACLHLGGTRAPPHFPCSLAGEGGYSYCGSEVSPNGDLAWAENGASTLAENGGHVALWRCRSSQSILAQSLFSHKELSFLEVDVISSRFNLERLALWLQPVIVGWSC